MNVDRADAGTPPAEAKRDWVAHAVTHIEDPVLRGIIVGVSANSVSAADALDLACDYVDTHRAVTRTGDHVERALLLADSALGAEGRDVSDADVRDLGRRVAEGTMTADEAVALIGALVDDWLPSTRPPETVDEGYQVGTSPYLERLCAQVTAGTLTEEHARTRSVELLQVERVFRYRLSVSAAALAVEVVHPLLTGLLDKVAAGDLSGAEAREAGIRLIGEETDGTGMGA